MSDDRPQMASSSHPDVKNTTSPSPDGREWTVGDKWGQKRDKSLHTYHNRKSQKTTDMSHGRAGEPSTDYTSGAGPSITCKHLL